jgi:uncharacterized protein (TIGR02246 family)
MRRHAAPLSFLLIALAACAQPEAAPPAAAQPEFTAADEAAIRALVAEWDRTWLAGDVDAIVALYSDTYLEMRPDIVQGREAARARIEAITANYTSLSTTVERLEGQGDLAWIWTSFHHTFDRDGASYDQMGNGLWVAKKGADGEWRFEAAGWQSRSTQTGS